jgi:exo-beta-1,3-glucanase (GH17 family)
MGHAPKGRTACSALWIGGLFFCLLPTSVVGEWVRQSSMTVSADVVPAETMFGLNFSPYMNGQSPIKRTPISESQIRSRMQLVAPYTKWVRTFSMVDGLEKAGAIAHSLGLKAALGAWIGPQVFAAGLAQNQLNIANLIAAGQRGEADLLIVGSEVLLRNDIESRVLIDYVNDVKAAVPGVPVAVADTDEYLIKAVGLRTAVDVVLVNIYPFWERVPSEWALFNLRARYQKMLAATPKKPIYISETGWPSCGSPVGMAVPSPENASAYLQGVQTFIKSENIPAFYFEAFDEEWKGTTEEESRGACWGMWDTEGGLKPGNNAFFQGDEAPNTWTGFPPVEGPGTPTVIISAAPSYGGKSPVFGKVLHVSPDNHHVVMYIHVGLYWFKKPFDATPYIIFQPDGNWMADMATGGIDELADKIRVYLFEESYVPTTVSGTSTLPAELEDHALAHFEIFRTSNPLAGAFLSPSADAIVTSPTLVQVDVQSSSGVTGVAFSVDGILRSTDSFHPFEYLWDPEGEPSGDHTLSARVMEITGNFVETSLHVVKP